MDGDRFDDLSRKLAAGASRRTALKGAAAGLLGAIGLRKAAGSQVSQAQCGNKVCASNPGVCNDGCVCCVYGNGNSRCRPPGECGSGTVVSPTTTTTTTTTAAPATGKVFECGCVDGSSLEACRDLPCGGGVWVCQAECDSHGGFSSGSCSDLDTCPCEDEGCGCYTEGGACGAGPDFGQCCDGLVCSGGSCIAAT